MSDIILDNVVVSLDEVIALNIGHAVMVNYI